MINPIIVPLFIPTAPDKCPGCGNEEDTVTVCKHCKHEYSDDEGIGFIAAMVVVSAITGFVVSIVWLILNDWIWVAALLFIIAIAGVISA